MDMSTSGTKSTLLDEVQLVLKTPKSLQDYTYQYILGDLQTIHKTHMDNQSFSPKTTSKIDV